ncbi:hypothetical protein EDB85DRAFT_982366 [Lactarius pseudohatsudake]|nr:hypothetical protein EDB85DRAFT_982366 [Lactarius pseudohatsudake]
MRINDDAGWMLATAVLFLPRGLKAANGETEPKPLQSPWSRHAGGSIIMKACTAASAAARPPTRPPSSNCDEAPHPVVLTTTVVHFPDMTQHNYPSPPARLAITRAHWDRVLPPPLPLSRHPPSPLPFGLHIS